MLWSDHQWLQFDVGPPKLVAGIVTKGRGDRKHWVTRYRVSYSNDSLQWHFYSHHSYHNTVTVSYIFLSTYTLANVLNDCFTIKTCLWRFFFIFATFLRYGILYRLYAVLVSLVVVLGLGVSSRTNFESLALALKVKSLLTTLAVWLKHLMSADCMTQLGTAAKCRSVATTQMGQKCHFPTNSLSRFQIRR